MTKWAKSGKKSKKKFKRSLTMTALPLSFFKGSTYSNRFLKSKMGTKFKFSKKDVEIIPTVEMI